MTSVIFWTRVRWHRTGLEVTHDEASRLARGIWIVMVSAYADVLELGERPTDS